MLYTRLFTLLCLFSLVAFVGCADTEAPEVDAEMGEEEMMEETMEMNNSILTVAEDAGLTTFRTAVAQANLDETLNGPGPFTVFAPSDEAFNALPEGTLESLMEEGMRSKLTDILTYHVIPSQVMSGELSGQMTVNTVQGQALTINAEGGTVTLTDAMGNTATVVSADNEAGNGVIHVISGVLMPAEGDMTEEDAM
ncbi:MAG: fasciclin domain-containing protein [Rhodothermales bacterium]